MPFIRLIEFPENCLLDFVFTSTVFTRETIPSYTVKYKARQEGCSTGPLGLATVKEHLSRDFLPTLYIRNPSKLPIEIKQNPKITVCHMSSSTGELSSTPTLLFPNLPKFTAIISAMGPPVPQKNLDTPLTDFYTSLLKHLSTKTYKILLLIVSTQTQPDPKDSFSLILWIGAILLDLFSAGPGRKLKIPLRRFLSMERRMIGFCTEWQD